MSLCCFAVYFRLENITFTTQTSARLKESDGSVRTSYISSRPLTTKPTAEANFQQVVSTSLIKADNTTTSSQYYFQPGFFPDDYRPDVDDVGFYVDSLLDNVTRQYVDVDDDDLRVRDLERVVNESAATSHRNHVTSRDPLFIPSSSVVGGRQPDVFTEPGLTVAAETGRHPPSSTSSWVPPTTTTTNSAENDEDWWRRFPFLGSVLTTTMMTSPENTMTATKNNTSTSTADDTASSTTLRSTMPSLSKVSDGHQGTRPSTSPELSTWTLSPVTASLRTTTSYLHHGYVDLDILEDHSQLDTVVRQSGTDEALDRGGGPVMTSTGVVLVVSIVIALLMLLSVIVLLVVYRYGPPLSAAAPVDCFPVGCRRHLIACGLGPSAVTRVATEDTSRPPPNATSTAADDLRTTLPSKSHCLSAGTVVVTSSQMKHGRVQSAANSHGVIEWYV